MVRKAMTDKEKVLIMCRDLMNRVERAKSRDITIRTLERRAITHDCLKDLQLVDGAMATVGEPAIIGLAYELRIEVKQ